jgi:hypothetical protein
MSDISAVFSPLLTSVVVIFLFLGSYAIHDDRMDRDINSAASPMRVCGRLADISRTLAIHEPEFFITCGPLDDTSAARSQPPRGDAPSGQSVDAVAPQNPDRSHSAAAAMPVSSLRSGLDENPGRQTSEEMPPRERAGEPANLGRARYR